MKRHCTRELPRAALLLLLLLCGSGRLRAADQDPERIRAAAEAAVRARTAGMGQVFVHADALDARLRLPECTAPLAATLSGDSGLRAQVQVGVRCSGARPWSIYLVVRIESEVPVLVARHALPRDARPRMEDFALETRRVAGLSTQFAGTAAALDGRRLRRPVNAGEALAIDALAVAPVVHRGEQVTLVARAGAMEIRVAAVALSDGRPDERIRVQNPASQRVIEGVVRAAGLVEVPL
jgi:flagella basal body P-ring formation protein FlgA